MTQEQVERMCGMIRREINSPGIAVFSHLYVSNMTRIKTLTNMPQVLMEGSKTFSGRSAWRKSTTTHEGWFSNLIRDEFGTPFKSMPWVCEWLQLMRWSYLGHYQKCWERKLKWSISTGSQIGIDALEWQTTPCSRLGFDSMIYTKSYMYKNELACRLGMLHFVFTIYNKWITMLDFSVNSNHSEIFDSLWQTSQWLWQRRSHRLTSTRLKIHTFIPWHVVMWLQQHV